MSTEDAERLAGLLRASEKLPALPQVVLTLNAMLQDPDTQTRDLSRIIEKDVALVTRILKLVNSAFFGLRSQVGNIPDAVSLLGFDTLHRLTLSLSVIGSVGRLHKNPGDWLWPHAVRTAVFCEHLAGKSRLCRTDDAFVAGLLHDIGLMILARSMPDLFVRIQEEADRVHRPLFVVESAIIPGFSHALLGAAMVEKWHLPRSLGEAIAHHHRLPRDKEASALTLLVHTANVLDIHGASLETGILPQGVLHPLAMEKLGPFLENPLQWFPDLCRHAGEACKIFLGEAP